jgi:hypothetical protein
LGVEKSLASDGPVIFMDYTGFNFYVRVGDEDEDETAVWDSFDSFQEAGDYIGAPREEEEEEEEERGDEGGEEEEEVVLDPPQPAEQIPPAAAATHIGRNTMSGINRDNMARNAVALLTSNPRFPAIGGTPVSWVEAERNWQEFSLSSFLGDRMTAWDDGQKGRYNKRKRAHEEVVRVRGDSMSTLMQTAIGLDEERSNLRNEKNRPMTFSQHLVVTRGNNTGVSTRNVTGRRRQTAPGGRNAQIERQRRRTVAQGQVHENAVLPPHPPNRLLTPAPAPNLGPRFTEAPPHDAVRGVNREFRSRGWERYGHVSGQGRIEEPDDG